MIPIGTDWFVHCLLKNCFVPPHFLSSYCSIILFPFEAKPLKRVVNANCLPFSYFYFLLNRFCPPYSIIIFFFKTTIDFHVANSVINFHSLKDLCDLSVAFEFSVAAFWYTWVNMAFQWEGVNTFGFLPTLLGGPSIFSANSVSYPQPLIVGVP